MKRKFYHVYGKAKTTDGKEHAVTVVGEFVQTRDASTVVETVDVETKPNSFVQGELKYNIKHLKRKLTLGMSICHPKDDFDEEVGIKVAKKRIKLGQDLGTIETNDVTMLTEDAIYAELVVKLNHIIENIDEYVPNED
jgi:hypothetical protein